jgi:hypothetical protein
MKEKIITIIQDWRTAVVLCLTLGLSPFFPEPHILGKIRWIAGGAVGMEWLDWFDFFLHGLPWVYLLYLLNKRFFS